MFTGKKKWNAHLTFLYPVWCKEDLRQTQHIKHFKAHSVNSCDYLAFLFFLISQRERLSRNKKLMGCSLCGALFCADGHWPARAFGNAPTETERLRLAAQQDKSLSENSWDTTQREKVTPLEPWRTVFPVQVYFPCLTAPWKSAVSHWTWLSYLGGMPFQLLLMHTKRNFVRQC